MKINQLQAL